MSEKPIIFSAGMVRAILAGRKTETRRVIKPQPQLSAVGKLWRYTDRVVGSDNCHDTAGGMKRVLVRDCPYGVPGDRLWVREAFWHDEPFHAECLASVDYVADHEPGWHPYPGQDGIFSRFVKHSPIHMWKWAARLWLEVVEVRVERVMDITPEAALAEGTGHYEGAHWVYDGADTALAGFPGMWNHINAKRGFGWDENPWVWVIRFKRVKA